jgi:hypothetical protein
MGVGLWRRGVNELVKHGRLARLVEGEDGDGDCAGDERERESARALARECDDRWS